MHFVPENPLIVQGDGSLLLEVGNPRAAAARDLLARFADLEKSPDHVHTWRIHALSLWNAASAGLSAEEICKGLLEFSRYEVPPRVLADIQERIGRWGKVVLLPADPAEPEMLRLLVKDTALLRQIVKNPKVMGETAGAIGEGLLRVPLARRGTVKQALLRLGFPVDDRAGFVGGTQLDVRIRSQCRSGLGFSLRRYQREAVEAWHRDGSDEGGHGVVVLPCGAGKTVVGIATMARAACQTLVLATGVTSVRQWIDEILDKTELGPDDVGEYSGECKEIRPVTVTTYQILTHRKNADSGFTHLGLFSANDWGLIVYDEVHLLPAPVFRVTAEIQARRRIGLTATLVREDGREGDVFTLIGPKRYDVPWKELEQKGFVAEAHCVEILVPLPISLASRLHAAEERARMRMAAENPLKLDLVAELLERHRGDKVLIIGMYLEQLEEAARRFGAPLVTGKTSNADRDTLYERFRRDELRVLCVSKVANFSINLPDANVAIQVSGTFGSRQEEAQRLGRILRPSGTDSWFYSVVTRGSREQEFAFNRQRFLTEQGYHYRLDEWEPRNRSEAPEPEGR
jgi:DNA excision repair protein ERCC-3